jgi:hypothetical protein
MLPPAEPAWQLYLVRAFCVMDRGYQGFRHLFRYSFRYSSAEA